MSPSLTTSSISRNDMSGETSVGGVGDHPPGLFGPGLAPDRGVFTASWPTCSSAASASRTRTSSGSTCRTGRPAVARVLPRRHVRELLVVAQRLVVGRLVLLAEMAAARLARARARRARAAPRTRGSRPRGRRTRAPGSGRARGPAPTRSARTPRAARGSRASALRRPGSLRAMPTSSHRSLPELAVDLARRPAALHRQQPRRCAPAPRRSASSNASCSVVTAGSGVPPR